MKTIELSDQEMTYLLIALRKYETALQAVDDEDEMGDALNDLLIVQGLMKRLRAEKENA